jgi:hypothetical protein
MSEGSYCSSSLIALQSLNDGTFSFLIRSEMDCLVCVGACDRDVAGRAVGGRWCSGDWVGLGGRADDFWRRARERREIMDRVFFFDRDFRGGGCSSGI